MFIVPFPSARLLLLTSETVLLINRSDVCRRQVTTLRPSRGLQCAQLLKLIFCQAYNLQGTETGTGGDSVTENLNLYYNAGDIAWMITATALVLLMIPGVG